MKHRLAEDNRMSRGKEPSWVRGEALKTVLALNEVRIGDEVKITAPDDLREGTTYGWPGERRVRVDQLLLEDPDGWYLMTDTCPCLACKKVKTASNLGVPLKNVKAWRRPVVDK